MNTDEVRKVARQLNTRYVKVVLNDNTTVLGTLNYSHLAPDQLDLLENSVHKTIDVKNVQSLEAYNV
jgi:hypothetical protein